MPSGEVHKKYHDLAIPAIILIAISGVVAGAWLHNFYLVEAAIWFVLWYAIGGRYIDPDWDQAGLTQAEGRMMRELGFAAIIFVPVSTMYAVLMGYLIKKLKIKGAIGGTHRTWLSHSIVPGTLIRMSIICLLLTSMLNYANNIINSITGGWIRFATYDILAFAIGQFLGLAASDGIHIVLDKFYGDDNE